jgi:hypothetical protein
MSDYFGKVYDLLVQYGARENDRDAFIRYMLDDSRSQHEWRFCGIFGFGGKCRRGPRGVSVDYYPEDHTKALDRKCAELNAKIAGLGVTS